MYHTRVLPWVWSSLWLFWFKIFVYICWLEVWGTINFYHYNFEVLQVWLERLDDKYLWFMYLWTMQEKRFPKRYLIVLLTFICTSVCYIERVGFSVAYTIAAGVNQSSKGPILSTFYYGYACSLVPGGWAAQKIGGRRVLLLSFVL